MPDKPGVYEILTGQSQCLQGLATADHTSISRVLTLASQLVLMAGVDSAVAGAR